MKLLKLLLVFGLLSKTIDARQSFCYNVADQWQSLNQPTFASGCQDHLSGCFSSVWTFKGFPLTIGVTAVNALQACISKSIYFNSFQSTILTSATTSILNTMSGAKNLNGTGLNVIIEFEKVFSAIVDEFIAILKTLTAIADLTSPFVDALDDLRHVFMKYMKDFIENSKCGCKKYVDFEPVHKANLKLLNTLASISKKVLDKCDATQEEYESVTVLHLIYLYVAAAVQGIDSCALNTRQLAKSSIPERRTSSSGSFDLALSQLTEAASAVTFPFNNNSKDFLSVFIKIAVNLNKNSQKRRIN